MPKLKKKPNDNQSVATFPVMLNVTSDNVVTWYGGKSYYDCLNNIGQRDSYCMAAEREKEARKTFDDLTNMPPPVSKKKKLSAVKLEAKYGDRVRGMYDNAGVTVQYLAERFSLSVEEIRILVRERK